MLPSHRLRALLREHDDPAHLEAPFGHDVPAARRRFARLVEAMERRFGPSVTAGGVQDASLLGHVSVPAPASGTGRPLWVLVSNFGPFVTAGTGKDWGMPDSGEGIDAAFVAWLDRLCTQLDCVYVPVELLLEPYDGPAAIGDEEIPAEALAALTDESGDQAVDADEAEDELPTAWWDRYFQFM
ncbi:hypothetical protein ACWDTQ_20265 [Streptomyces cellulosae]|mgnify:CR=1 FL=1|jgi:hypothetical protein|uniref:hypothetical protein n=1 Tax=Streptomyces sp. enrichment culture TaxID=1795815 RepID=UPI0010C12A43